MARRRVICRAYATKISYSKVDDDHSLPPSPRQSPNSIQSPKWISRFPLEHAVRPECANPQMKRAWNARVVNSGSVLPMRAKRLISESWKKPNDQQSNQQTSWWCAHSVQVVVLFGETILYFLIFRCRVDRLMPSLLAVAVIFQLFCFKRVSMRWDSATELVAWSE